MARKLRVEYPGACYHVMAQGFDGKAIVSNEGDRELFRTIFAEACLKTGWKIHAWVLMKDHYRVALETPDPNLVSGMKWLQNSYTRRLNIRHSHWGRVFGDRYKSIVIETDITGSGGEVGNPYLGALIDYIHLTPVRSGLLKKSRGKSLADYPWSSLSQGYLLPASERNDWMVVKKGLAAHGLKDSPAGRKRYLQILEDLAAQQPAAQCGCSEIEGQTLNSTLERGWYLGSPNFRKKLLGLLKKEKQKGGSAKRSRGRAKPDDVKEAEEWIKRGLKHFAGAEKEPRPGRWPFRPNAAIAWAIHRRTTLPHRWIARRLDLKSSANVSLQVKRWEMKDHSPREQAWEKWVKTI